MTDKAMLVPDFKFRCYTKVNIILYFILKYCWVWFSSEIFMIKTYAWTIRKELKI